MSDCKTWPQCRRFDPLEPPVDFGLARLRLPLDFRCTLVSLTPGLGLLALIGFLLAPLLLRLLLSLLLTLGFLGGTLLVQIRLDLG